MTTKRRQFVRSLIFALTSLPLLLPLSCAKSSLPRDSAKVEKVLVISIDTLRADFLGAYSEGTRPTPNLDYFAKEGVVFEDAMAQAPFTAPSHKSIFYSVYPHVHKTRKSSVPKELVTSPIEVLRRSGMTTGAFVGGGQLGRNFGFQVGYDDYWVNDSYRDRAEKRHLAPMEPELDRWIDEHHDEPFFLFVHTYQTHCPYVPPEPYRSELAGWYDGDVDPDTRCGGDFFEDYAMDSTDLRFVRDLYAAEVAYVDEFLGRLFDRLRSLGIYDETMIVFLSDHGESLGESGHIGHGKLVEEQLRVPLIIKVPGGVAGRVREPVELLDVMPTVYSTVGAEPPFEFQGRDLSGFLHDPEAVPGGFDSRIRIAEKSREASVTRGGWRLVLSSTKRGPEARLLRRGEEHIEESDRALEYPEIVRELRDSYERVLSRDRALGDLFLLDGEGSPTLDARTRRQLEVLGYIR